MHPTSSHSSPKTPALTPRALALSALMCALICVLSQVSIPLGTMPVTLQTFAVGLTGYLLGWRRGALAVAAYLCLGAVGVPVFTGFSGGIGTFAQATGGFRVGFVPMVMVCGLSASTPHTWRGIMQSGAVGMLSLAALYIPGCGWLAQATGIGALTAVKMMLPFLLKDAVSIVLASLLAHKLAHRLKIGS